MLLLLWQNIVVDVIVLLVVAFYTVVEREVNSLINNIFKRLRNVVSVLKMRQLLDYTAVSNFKSMMSTKSCGILVLNLNAAENHTNFSLVNMLKISVFSFGVYVIVLSGWSVEFSTVREGLRPSAQMISYEVIILAARLMVAFVYYNFNSNNNYCLNALKVSVPPVSSWPGRKEILDLESYNYFVQRNITESTSSFKYVYTGVIWVAVGVLAVVSVSCVIQSVRYLWSWWNGKSGGKKQEVDDSDVEYSGSDTDNDENDSLNEFSWLKLIKELKFKFVLMTTPGTINNNNGGSITSWFMKAFEAASKSDLAKGVRIGVAGVGAGALGYTIYKLKYPSVPKRRGIHDVEGIVSDSETETDVDTDDENEEEGVTKKEKHVRNLNKVPSIDQRESDHVAGEIQQEGHPKDNDLLKKQRQRNMQREFQLSLKKKRDEDD